MFFFSLFVKVSVARGGIDDKTAPVCQGKCEEFPNCDEFCKRIGFKSGQCVPPLEQFCCCDP